MFRIKRRGDSEILGELTVAPVSLGKAAARLRFERDGDHWVLRGEGTSRATFTRGHLERLEGNVAVRLYDKSGYVGIGQETRVVVSNERRSVMLKTQMDTRDPDLISLLDGLSIP